MIIHNPIVSGSLTFADNATLTSALSTITGSFRGDILSTNGLVSSSAQVITLLPDGVVSGSTQVVDLLPTGVISGSSQVLGGSGIVSSSEQISNYNTFLEINGMGIISASDQVNADTIQQFDANVEDALNNKGVISGSTQVIASDTFNFDTAVTNVMDGATVVSGSDQVTSSLDNRYVNVTGNETVAGNKTFTDNVTITGNLTVDGTTTTTSTNNVIVGDNIIDLNYGGGATDGGLYVTDVTVSGLETGSLLWDGVQNRWVAGVKNSEIKILLAEGDGIISSSEQLTSTFLEVNGNNVLSSSAQISNYGVFAELNGGNLVSSSAQISNYGVFAELNGGGLISSSEQLTSTFLEINGDNVISSSEQLTSTFLEINGDNVISASSQVVLNDADKTGFDTDDVSEGSNLYYTDARVKTKLDNEGAISGSSQVDGTSISNNSITIAGTSTSLGGSITYAKIAEGTGTISGSSQLDGTTIGSTSPSIFSGSFSGSFVGDGSQLSGVTSYTDADTLAYINSQNVFSSSIQVDVASTTNYSSINQYSDSKVKTYLDSQTVISASSQITITESQISDLDHYTDSDVKTKLNAEGVFSSSAQIEGNFLEVDGDNVVSSSTQISSYDVFLEKNGDGVVSGSSQLSNVFLSKDGDSVVSGSTQLQDNYDLRYLQINGDNVISGASQLYTDLDARYGNEEGEGLISSSAQIQGFGIFAELNGDGLISSSAQLTDTFLEINGDNVISGSAQVVSSLVSATGISTGNKTTIQSNLGVDAAGTKNSTDVTLAGSYNYITAGGTDNQTLTLGQVDASTDISNLTTTNVSEGTNKYYTDARVKTKLDAEGVISGSAQIQGDFLELNGDSVLSGSGTINHISFYNSENGLTSHDYLKVNPNFNLFLYDSVSYSDAIRIQMTGSLSILGGISALEQNSTFSNAYFEDIQANYVFAQTGSFQRVVVPGIILDDGNIIGSSTSTGSFGRVIGDGSELTGLTTTIVSEGTNLYYTDARVKTKLNAEGVISASSQITITESQISDLDHYTDSDWDSRLATKSTTNLSEGTNLYYTDARVKTKLNAEGVISASSQITITESQISDLDHYTDSDWDTRLATKSTDNLSEGSTNKYASTANVKSALNANLGTLTLGDSDDTVSIPGNLTVSGTTTTVNSNTVNIGDNIIVLNSDETGTPSQNGGIEIERGTSTNSTLLWDEGNDYWVAGLAGSEVQIALVNGTYSGLRAQSTTKGDVGLGNVENTALSTWAGTSNITTLGTISTGTWQGTAIADAYLSSNTAHLSETQTFSGAKTFSAAVNITNSTASTSKTTGALKVTGGVGISGALNVGGDVVAYASSDERLKDNIELISNPIEKVQSLKGVTWNWNENADELQQSLPNVGVIAQDVEKVLPQLVHDRDNGFKGVDYAKLTGLLIEAIKEQQKQIDELKSKLQ